jgi:hypothetical protein
MQITIEAKEQESQWAQSLADAIKTACERLEGVTSMAAFYKSLRAIIIDDTDGDGRTKETLGYYTPYLGTMRLYARRLKSVEVAIYVFLHEFSHHVAHKRTGLDPSYCSKSQNKAFCKEELRADSLALALLKKYFDNEAFKEAIKMVKNRIKAIKRLFKGEKSPYTYEFQCEISWDRAKLGQMILAA